MGSIDIKSTIKTVTAEGTTEWCHLYKQRALRKFCPAVLELGDIGNEWEKIDVLAAVFDLGGFTSFCNQVDSHLSLPKFVKEFLNWLFKEIRSELVIERFEDGIGLYSQLPIFAKFMGDGVLFLWDASHMHMVLICNVAILLREVVNRYRSNFVPKMRGQLLHYPKNLKCGVALGTVCSVGEGKDYVGMCINVACRLQKYSNIGFCLSKTGIDMKEGMTRDVAKRYMVRRAAIRGIGDEELVIVNKSDFAKLSPEGKAQFKRV